MSTPGDQAGRSARDSASRQREKAERLMRSAELWERGAVGEETTGALLAKLPPEEWTVLHDRRWPGRRFANVDHVVIGPGGVFVIDSKNWSGTVTVINDVLRCNGRVREAAVAGAADSAIAVSELTRAATPQQVHPVLCFVREQPVQGWARDVMVCSTANLLEMLATRPPVLSPERRRLIAIELDASMRAATDQVESRSTTPVLSRSPHPSQQGPRPRAGSRNRRRPNPLARLLLAIVMGLAMLAIGPSLIRVASERLTDSFTRNLSAPGGGVPPSSSGTCAAEHSIKGLTNADGRQVYRLTSSTRYAATKAEVCFASAEEAQAAGYQAARR